MSRYLHEVDNKLVTAVISDQEIFEAVKQLLAVKAPGPDGIHIIFYQKSWNLVRKSVSDLVKSFFQNGHILIKTRTYITLIPEIDIWKWFPTTDL